jgi:hypothetical protein
MNLDIQTGIVVRYHRTRHGQICHLQQDAAQIREVDAKNQ